MTDLYKFDGEQLSQLSTKTGLVKFNKSIEYLEILGNIWVTIRLWDARINGNTYVGVFWIAQDGWQI